MGAGLPMFKKQQVGWCGWNGGERREMVKVKRNALSLIWRCYEPSWILFLPLGSVVVPLPAPTSSLGHFFQVEFGGQTV